MKLPKELTTPTSVSKSLGLILFIVIPILSYMLGMKHQASTIVNISKHVDTDGISVSPTPSSRESSQSTEEISYENQFITYTNQLYGFSFQYPANWKLISRENSISLKDPKEITLAIGFKKKSDLINIVRSGVGSGEITNKGTILFLGQSLEKNVLVSDGDMKSILYNNAGEIEVQDIIFTLSLDNLSFEPPPTFYGSVTKEAEDASDKVLESFILSK